MTKQFTRVEPTVVQVFGDAYPWTAVVKHFQTQDGAQHQFTTVYAEGYQGVCVIALTPDNRVVTAYQFRAGPERWMYELPGGELHQAEDPAAGALRELEEETGYRSDHLTLLGKTSRSAYNNATWFCYLARDCYQVPTGAHADAEEAAQGLEVRIITIEQLLQYAKTDRMSDPVAVLFAYDTLQTLIQTPKEAQP